MNKEIMAFILSAMTLLAGSVHMLQPTNTKLEVAATPAIDIPEEIVQAFENWKVEHGKTYTSNDYQQYRLGVFHKNWVMIAEHNSNPAHTYRMAPNQFMDMTQEEFIATYLTLKVDESKKVEVVESYTPNAIDWHAAGKVTGVKNQGSCGSCWAFSTTGVLESWALITGRGNHNFSEQQLVDCSRAYGNQGCNGGWPTSALNYVRDHGITEQGSYPYTGRDGACRAQGGAFRISGHKDISAGNCTQMSQSLASSPLSVCVDASNWSFYAGGVFSNCASNINHAVLLTGQDGQGNWMIKNSWGTGWGAGGYITLRGGNTCGVCHYPTVPY